MAIRTENTQEAKIDGRRNNPGRPPIYPDKPWERLGISRRTWYRRGKPQ